MHGHMHVAGGGATKDGRRVASFGRDTMPGSLAFLDLRTLRLEVPTVQQMREAAFPRWVTADRFDLGTVPQRRSSR